MIGFLRGQVIEKAPKDALARPSLTLMRILLCVPPWVGVPLNRPVEVLKLADSKACP